MSIALKRYIQYQFDQQMIAQAVLHQASVHTAMGKGLDDILDALWMTPRGRLEPTESGAIYLETDAQIRERILKVLGIRE